MSNSQDQFNQLIASIIVKSNHSLAEGNTLTPFGLAFQKSNNIEIIVNTDKNKLIKDQVESIKLDLQKKVESSSYVATAIVYPDYEKSCIKAYLENSDLFCLKVIIPVSAKNGLSLDVENISSEQGGIYVYSNTKIH